MKWIFTFLALWCFVNASILSLMLKAYTWKSGILMIVGLIIMTPDIYERYYEKEVRIRRIRGN